MAKATKSLIFDKLDLIRQAIEYNKYTQEELEKLYRWAGDTADWLDKYIDKKQIRERKNG